MTAVASRARLTGPGKKLGKPKPVSRAVVAQNKHHKTSRIYREKGVVTVVYVCPPLTLAWLPCGIQTVAVIL